MEIIEEMKKVFAEKFGQAEAGKAEAFFSPADTAGLCHRLNSAGFAVSEESAFPCPDNLPAVTSGR